MRRPVNMSLRPAMLAVGGLVCAVLAAPAAHSATTAEVEAKLNALTSQVDELRAELAQLKAQEAAASGKPLPPAAPAASAAATATGAVASPLQWMGYGELNYSRPTDDAAATTADVGRFVLGVTYAFDDRTKLVSEVEVEHAVSSADDPGEVEIEQAYIERQIHNSMFAKAGLFLIPVGLINENHEPTHYYGVFRNQVETQIIPTTWREGGFELEGNTLGGLRWNAGITTGFNLSKWDATSTEGQQAPLGSIHQELALAAADDLAQFVALNYTGIPGLRLGASVFTGDAAQGQPGFDNNRVTLWEAHARWNPGNWDLSALYSRGSISNTRDVNLTLVGNPTLIPESFFGWYVEAAYRANLANDWTLSPFARYEQLNTGSSYATLAPGLTPDPPSDERIFTAGFNFGLARGVVFKLDYQHFERDSTSSRFDLGIGYQF